jgi:cyclophilin family peptidyl-prolyl cis-trans isomerase
MTSQGRTMMTLRHFSFLALIGILAMTTANASADDKHPQVLLDTSEGPITIELDAEKAPISTANFLKHVRDKDYDGTIFHRVIPDFMIQGGGFDAKARGQQDARERGKPIQNEAANGLKNKRGTIAMARTGDPHSATAQFFINLKDNTFLDHTAPTRQGYGYAVFGKVVDGMDTVDKIAAVRTKSSGVGDDYPVEPITIKSATVKAN